MQPNTKTDTVVGTGAAINVSVGWKPDYIEIYNVTDGNVLYKWYKGMTAGHASKQQSVTDNATTGNASLAPITSNGLSQYDGDATNPPGFTIGSAISLSGKTLAYTVTRNGAGI